MVSLITLPPEILTHVISYTAPFDILRCSPHYHYSLYALAATCRDLHIVVEEYARVLLKHYTGFPDENDPKQKKWANRADFVQRRAWAGWLSTGCQWCGRNSRRKAIVRPGLTCCAKCDQLIYKTITMTTILQDHHLSQLDVFTPSILHPTLPPLLYGAATVAGLQTIKHSLALVLARKALIQSRLDPAHATDETYLKRRAAALERVLKHLPYTPIPSLTCVKWVVSAPRQAQIRKDEEAKERLPQPWQYSTVPKSMRSAERREAYVRKNLEREWRAMGMDPEHVPAPPEVTVKHDGYPEHWRWCGEDDPLPDVGDDEEAMEQEFLKREFEMDRRRYAALVEGETRFYAAEMLGGGRLGEVVDEGGGGGGDHGGRDGGDRDEEDG